MSMRLRRVMATPCPAVLAQAQDRPVRTLWTPTMGRMAPDAPHARDDDDTTDAPEDDAPEGIAPRTKVLWAIGAAIGAYFIVSGLIGILG